jgi:hypothetical protein
VLWTYPADGAVDVPTNTQLLVSDEFGSTPSLNGKTLSMSRDGAFDLGELAPYTTYRVTWPPPISGGAQAISFTTGGGPSLQSAPATPEPLQVRRAPSDYEYCPLVRSQGCFDTGAPVRASFAPSEDAIAWLVESSSCDGTARMVWPAECGPPVIESYDARICVRLRATDGVHMSESTRMICSLPSPAPDGSTRATSSSCIGVDFPPTGALLLTSKDDVPCSSDGTSACVDPTPSPPAVSEPTPMAAPPTDVVTEPRSADGCSVGRPGARSGAPWLALAIAAASVRSRQRGAHRSSWRLRVARFSLSTASTQICRTRSRVRSSD